MQVEQPVRKVSKKPTKSKNQESRALFPSMDVSSSSSQQKRFVNRPGQFVASQLRKRKVEVSVKNLSQDELRQLDQAKQNEIRQYLQNEVMQTLRGNEENREDELMGMRWVVTVKHFPEKRSKGGWLYWVTKPVTWKTSCLKRQHRHQHVEQSTVSCKWQHITVLSSKGQTCGELSCKVVSNRRTGTWFQKTSWLMQWESREENSKIAQSWLWLGDSTERMG